ncbi:hypothetical protein HOU65_gp018 [Salmonella phage Seafire]|uniref:Uncharacterized protein n=1 Tax=Salmonella phage Seafire TaxID=2483612 RepID=A0A3G8F1F4_9CAUD|nr:hypothetical protein HOU65_gp018 [Salmonella phage Seafire]AZF87907.1 hypothetical protein CPT_Seafire_018 [Salmonella phage Seafire]
MPEFLEPQEFSPVKLFCPILLIKFRFISHNLNSIQNIPHYPQKRSKPVLKHHHRCSFRSSPQVSLALSTSPQTHTITHPPIEASKILSDSHILTLVGFAHILVNPAGLHRSCGLLEFLGKFIVGFAHIKNISHRICTLPKIVGFAHTRPHVTPVEQCRICTKAQGKMKMPCLPKCE